MADFFTYYADPAVPGAVWRYASGKDIGDYGRYEFGELRWAPAFARRYHFEDYGGRIIPPAKLRSWLMQAVKA